MLADAGLPKNFWAEAVSTAVYLINRSPASGIWGKTPEEIWSGEKPDLRHKRKKWDLRKKWDAKSEEYILVGYCEETKGYNQSDHQEQTENSVHESVSSFTPEETGVEEPKIVEANQQQEEEREIVENPAINNIEILSDEGDDHEEFYSPSGEAAVDEWIPDDEVASEAGAADEENQELRRSTRTRKPVIREDYVSYLTYDRHSTDPQSADEALKSPEREAWIRAMKSEYNSLIDNKTWELVDPPPEKKLLHTKWVFKTKRKSNGEIERHKAKLVVKGYAQKAGVHYEETYAPVMRHNSLKFLFALAVRHNYTIERRHYVSSRRPRRRNIRTTAKGTCKRSRYRISLEIKEGNVRLETKRPFMESEIERRTSRSKIHTVERRPMYLLQTCERKHLHPRCLCG